jgi:hypothetical protein
VGYAAGSAHGITYKGNLHGTYIPLDVHHLQVAYILTLRVMSVLALRYVSFLKR